MSSQLIRALRRPGANAGLRGVAIAVSLAIALPVLAAAQGGERKSVVANKAQAGKQVRKSAVQARAHAPVATAHGTAKASEAVPAAESSVTLPLAAQVDTTATIAVTPPPTAPTHSKAAREDAAPPIVNPYLAGWFRPTPVAELPNLAAQQFGTHAQWAIQSVTGVPGQVVAALPSIKRVFPTGGRELWVVNAKCPAEMVTGQYFFPANAVRDVVNGLLGTLNASQLLTFDIQLVCS